MIRGTTPTYIIKISGDNLKDATPYVTISQGQTEITKSGEGLITDRDDTSCVLTVALTQEETLKLAKGRADLQVRWVNTEGTAGATDVKCVKVKPVLLEGVISHE